MPGLDDFFRELDRAWVSPGAAPIPLHLIGSTALMLQARYSRGTKDSDLLETLTLTPEVQKQLMTIGGPGSELRRRHGLYLQIVSSAVPFLPQVPRWIPLGPSMSNFRLQVLSVVDVVVSKLYRMNASDTEDIEAMVDLGCVPHEQLLERFRSAADMLAGDARGYKLPEIVENLHRVERDMIGVEETEIELPSWI